MTRQDYRITGGGVEPLQELLEKDRWRNESRVSRLIQEDLDYSREPRVILEFQDIAGSGKASGSSLIRYSSLAASILLFLLAGFFFLPRFSGNGPSIVHDLKKGEEETFMKAIVLQKIGQAFVRTGSEKRELHTGDVLQGQLAFFVEVGSEIDLSLANGVRLHIKENSTLDLEKAVLKKDGNTYVKMNLSKGGILASIDKTTQNSDFAVVTPTAVAGVRGTVFQVDLNEDQSTRVSVLNGAVLVQGRWKDSHPVILEEKTGARLQEGKPVQPEPVQVEELANLEQKDQTLKEKEESVGATIRHFTDESSPAGSESKLMEKYDRGLEQIELEDGRVLRGMIVSQQGDRMIVESADGIHIIQRRQLKRVIYLDP